MLADQIKKRINELRLPAPDLDPGEDVGPLDWRTRYAKIKNDLHVRLGYKWRRVQEAMLKRMLHNVLPHLLGADWEVHGEEIMSELKIKERTRITIAATARQQGKTTMADALAAVIAVNRAGIVMLCASGKDIAKRNLEEVKQNIRKLLTEDEIIEVDNEEQIIIRLKDGSRSTVSLFANTEQVFILPLRRVLPGRLRAWLDRAAQFFSMVRQKMRPIFRG